MRAWGIRKEEISFFSWFWPRGREREEKESNKPSLFDLWSSVGWNSSSQELKFIAATRAKRGYQKERISPKISRKRFGGKSKFSGLGGVLKTSYRSTTLQEVGILPTLVLVPIFWLIFGLKIMERVMGLFGQKNAQNSTFFA